LARRNLPPSGGVVFVFERANAVSDSSIFEIKTEKTGPFSFYLSDLLRRQPVFA